MGDRMWNLNNLREGLPGLLVSPSRGLFIYQPWAILMFGTFLLSLRSRSESVHAIHWLCLPVIVLHVLLVGCWCCWWGGDSWGSRLLTEIIPWIGLLCLPAITCLRQHFSGMLLLTVLVGISVWMQTQGAFFNQHWNRRMQIENHPEMLWSWKQAPWIRIQQ